jgi:hypothetical protein
VRFGKVKVPSGLFNETQDIDPSYMFALLPQSIYPLPSRNGQLAAFGGVAYGSLNEFSKKVGQLQYRFWAGERVLPSNDGYWTAFNESGITLSIPILPKVQFLPVELFPGKLPSWLRTRPTSSAPTAGKG